MFLRLDYIGTQNMPETQTILKLGQDYKQTIRKALELLNKKQFSLIIHGASFPSVEFQDTGMGSFCSEGAKKLVDFAQGIFTSIQLGPAGKTKAIDASPYTGTVFSNNPLFIDLYELTQDNYANLLSSETFNSIVENNPNKGVNKVAYSYIFTNQMTALKEAFSSFNLKLVKKDKQAVAMKKELDKFTAQNNDWLEKDALYEALSVKHNNDYWPAWDDEIDRNLFNMNTKEGQIASAQRIKEIQSKYVNEIEFYNFCQFIAAKQKEEMKNYALSKGIKMIADRQVAFSDRDCWANQALFLKGWCLGCPPDYFSKDGQAWGFSVMNPEKMFNKNGSLGEGGKLMFNLYRKMFKENPGGVRIDHFVGLVDPWVYKEGFKPKAQEGAGRLYSSPEHPELSRYAIAKESDLNLEFDSDSEYRVKSLTKEQISRYAALIEKIVMAAAKAEGIGKDSIICEDLGTLTYPVEKVMEQFELSGMRLTQFVKPEKPEHPYRGINTDANSWIMVGTHDNEPVSMWAKSMINTAEGYLHAKNLSADLCLDKNYIDSYAVELSKNAQELTKAKLVELFTANSQNIQLFFTDFFGIEDVYNKPGTSGEQNWSLRLPNNFEWFYFNQLAKGKAANLAQILIYALKVKGLDAGNYDLVKKLEEYAFI
ncbi:MAG: 4-alpha-glucanotransferase [Candidatus Gastranaerophilales bacterium]|nr:4-alpha-glucanotransferase [Candidatus Gastranaerophilales bacterium]